MQLYIFYMIYAVTQHTDRFMHCMEPFIVF
jgi:hypothetical protein